MKRRKEEKRASEEAERALRDAKTKEVTRMSHKDANITI